MVREVKKEEAKRYLAKAESFYVAAQENLQKGWHDVCVFNASQAIILANDAICIAILGRRPSKDHREAIQLHIQALAGRENKKEIVKDALEKRGEFGYTEKTATQEDAHRMIVCAKRFIDWVKEKLMLK